MNEYMVSIVCSWVERVKANSIDEAIKKTEKLYRCGKGRFPREFVEVSEEKVDFVQVED